MGGNENAILAVGAHPDDIEIGCGGSIAKHLSLGDRVLCLIMTNGEKGNHKHEKEECLTSLGLLGLKEVYFGNFRDGFLSDNLKTVSLIESYINKFGVNRVYTHFPNDRHQDHRHCSFATTSAARKITEILYYQGPSSIIFEPHYFIEISEENLEKKIKSIKCYETQVSKGTVNPDLIKSIAELHGSTCNKKYAEAFAINHLFREGSYV